MCAELVTLHICVWLGIARLHLARSCKTVHRQTDLAPCIVVDLFFTHPLPSCKYCAFDVSTCDLMADNARMIILDTKFGNYG